MAIIGVMGSGKEPWESLAKPLGVWIAHSGHHLLTGGGQGVMACVAQAFCSVPDRPGRSIGIIPTQADRYGGFVALPGYPNDYIEIPILTPLPRHDAGAAGAIPSRNHVNVLTSDVVIALPGGGGTHNEIGLSLGFHKPVMGFGPARAFADAPRGLRIAASLDDVAAFICATLTI